MAQDNIMHQLAMETVNKQLHKLSQAIVDSDTEMIGRLYYFEDAKNETGVMQEFGGCKFEVEMIHFIRKNRLEGILHCTKPNGERIKYETFLTRNAKSPTDWNISLRRI